MKDDYDDYKDRQRRDMWKAFPKERLAQIRRSIKRMDSGRDKIILELAFVYGLTTTEIAEVAKTRLDMLSRNGRPVSRRTIQLTIEKYIPDRSDYQDHSQRNKPHSDHGFFAAHHKKERCANCGGTEKLEWHHMIPAFLGGLADEENMICLCHNCHQAVTAYHRKLYPDEMNAWKKKRAESRNKKSKF